MNDPPKTHVQKVEYQNHTRTERIQINQSFTLLEMIKGVRSPTFGTMSVKEI